MYVEVDSLYNLLWELVLSLYHIVPGLVASVCLCLAMVLVLFWNFSVRCSTLNEYIW